MCALFHVKCGRSLYYNYHSIDTLPVLHGFHRVEPQYFLARLQHVAERVNDGVGERAHEGKVLERQHVAEILKAKKRFLGMHWTSECRMHGLTRELRATTY
jgi:hypothetical protein